MTMAHLTLLAFILALIVTASAMSWTSKEKQREYIIASAMMEEYVDSDCFDDHENCNQYVPLCTKFKIVSERCKVTCGTCARAPGPPLTNCTQSKYGCCWDNVTVAQGANYRGCEACVDKFAECKYFKDKCADANHSRIRLICPVTCGVGCEKKQCLDNPYQADVCKIYKKYNFCSISPNLMEQICAKTCGFC